MGILDILILGIVAAAFLAAVRHLKKHGSGCGGDCASCGRKGCSAKR